MPGPRPVFGGPSLGALQKAGTFSDPEDLGQ